MRVKVTVLVSVLVLRPAVLALVLVLRVSVSVLVLVLKVNVLVLVSVLPKLSWSHHCREHTHYRIVSLNQRPALAEISEDGSVQVIILSKRIK